MALKALMLRKKIDDKQKALDALRALTDDFAKREAELETAIGEITAESTDEERTAVEESVEAFDSEKRAHDEKVATLESEIGTMRSELEQIEAAQKAPVQPAPTTPDPPAAATESRKEITHMETRTKNSKAALMRIRSAVAPYMQREDVRALVAAARTCMIEKRALSGAGILIPDVFMGILRENIMDYSKLYARVNVVPLSGNGRQVVAGTVPEAIWTEACANLNELDLAFNSVEMDNYKVGGYMAVCNATLEDSEIDLVSEIMLALAQSIGIALDKAILYGTGTKMPLGIVTRLVQTSAPSDQSPTARPWVDLHTSNVRTIAAGVTGTALISELTIDSGYAKSKYSRGGKIWCMNETTYTMLIANAVTVTAAGAIVSGVNGTMPVVGGDCIILDFIPNNIVVGGYLDLYTLGERRSAQFGTSEHAFFLADQTVFKGTARYDGKPSIPEAFVVIGLNGVTPSAAMTFAPDVANADPQLSALTIGTLSLTPAFDASTYIYTATAATGGKAKISATAVDKQDGITITVNGTSVKNGSEVTWAAGANTVAVTVTNNSDPSAVSVYTIAVTAS